MKFFDFFDKLHNDHKRDYDIPVEKHPEKLWKIKKQKYRAIAYLEKVQQENIILKEETSELKSKLKENNLYE
jgi:mRNA-degrading endonuclease RelE of RelBE toxin-antitoxin system